MILRYFDIFVIDQNRLLENTWFGLYKLHFFSKFTGTSKSWSRAKEDFGRIIWNSFFEFICQDDEAKIAAVKDVYNQLNLRAVFEQYEENSKKKVQQLIKEVEYMPANVIGLLIFFRFLWCSWTESTRESTRHFNKYFIRHLLFLSFYLFVFAAASAWVFVRVDHLIKFIDLKVQFG